LQKTIPYSFFSKNLSRERLSRYLIASNGDEKVAIEFYEKNLFVSQALHPLVGTLEVVLRNNIHREVSRFLKNDNWLFETDHPSVKLLLEQNRNQGIHTNINMLIAGLPFSFWTTMFERKTFLKYNGRPIKIFNKLPAGLNRKTIKIKLTAVRHLRNRISHNEPICFEGQRFTLKKAERIFEETITIFEWIDPIFVVWLKKFTKSAHLFY
jgi:hypothetical protein